MQADAFRDVRPALAALFGGGAFILLICCVNVTSLLLARASDRRREIALRIALGASRLRILRQLLAEAALLSSIGAVAGAAIGASVFRGLLAIRPERLARVEEPGFLWPVFLAAALGAGVATALVALLPALQSLQTDPIDALRTHGLGWMTRMQRRIGRMLVVGEMVLGFVLVTGSVLAARTLTKIEQVRPGFEPRQVLAFQLVGMRPGLLAEWEARFASIPGVLTAGAISHLPFDNTLPNCMAAIASRMTTETRRYSRPTIGPSLSAISRRWGFADRGPLFRRATAQARQNAVTVDEVWRAIRGPTGRSPIGKPIEAEHMVERGLVLVPSVVVGVVEHVSNHSLTKEVRGQIYSPFAQNLRGGFPETFALRTAVAPMSLVPAIRRLLQQNTPALAMDKVRPMTDTGSRDCACVLRCLQLRALACCATGIFSVLNYQSARIQGWAFGWRSASPRSMPA
jgi:hypothetical protein